MLPLALIAAAFGQAETSFVNVKSSQWNVVFRITVTETRIERMAAKCGSGWVNVCSSKVSPAQREQAFRAGLTPGTRLMGDFASCRSARLPRLGGVQLQGSTLSPDASAFCEVLQPGSSRGMASSEPAFRGGSTGGAVQLPPAPVMLSGAGSRPAPRAPVRPQPGPAPAPRSFPRAPAPTTLGVAPSAVATRARPAVPRPVPSDRLGDDGFLEPGFDLPTITTASSMDEFDILDLDQEDDPKVAKKEAKKEKKKKSKKDEPALRDRSLPR